MDRTEAWSKIAGGTKTARLNTARALDSVAPLCAPLAARWDAEADRRRKLRTPENLKKLMEAQRNHTSARALAARARTDLTRARKDSRNPLSAGRRAAATANRAAKKGQKSARAGLSAARREYPATLGAVATAAHAGHTLPAGIATWAMASPWPVATSAALIAGNAAAVLVGRRSVTAAVPDDLTAEERRLVERLDPSYWVQHAEERGLAGTVPSPAELTPAGLVTQVRLDGRWKPSSFRAKHEEIRAMLGARTDLRMEIKPGSHGDRATITLRTRSAADGVELTGWTPGAPWGVDTVTGEPVMVPLGRRMLIAGTSGSGKSWSTRALLAEASETEDHRLVVIDPKRVEALNWEHRALTAVRADDVLSVSDLLVVEMHERLEEIPRGRDTIAVTPARPRITVFVDEGAEVISMAREKGHGRIMDNFRTLARMARAAEIILIWATQKPTMDKNGGIDPQISAQITYRAALALSTSSESRVVFGEDATERGWHAHDLPMPGVALLRSGPKVAPHPIRTRAFSPADVIALPDRPIWHRQTAAAPAPVPVPAESARPALRLVKDAGGGGAAPPAASVPAPRSDAESAVLDAVRAGAVRQKDVVTASGLAKGTVSKTVARLVERGELVRAEDGSLSIAAGEVSA
ncbi:MarR family transcriptional regulator [Streptomyces sp. CNQ085]|uniref:MarR family transcriptional regulator n=1 Tax=Streptomyces sp. CNQ085 TaxID=2886944 RepID=UPI001F509E95|nr:MarR family transcriptional regulator [Streptomyces sp. CNQ085]MCI0387005.1 DUF87 domain-containing protein [Streptomyces sp. CNQ085]